jgi:gliding motility-associated-like protein
LRVTYRSCTTPTGEVSFDDTITLKKEKLNVSLQVQDPTCTSSGSITVNAEGTSAPFLYSLNGGPSQTTPTFANLPEGAYNVSVSSATCTRYADTTLVLQDNLTLAAPAAQSICAGDQFTPAVTSNGTSFNWSPTVGVSNPGEQSPQIKGINSTTYTVTASKGICQRTALLQLTVKPLPVVNAGADQTIVQGDEIQFAATANADSVRWTPATGLNTASTLNPSATPLATTTYRLTATANGCTASDEITIQVAPYCVKPMNAFSPNGDGINDHWSVTTGSCLNRASVDVFNRYGAVVYHNDNYQNDWNGTYTGKPLSDGTYYYVITYQLINGKTVSLKGNVTILR